MSLRANSVTPILPNEIWEHILLHLEKSEVQRLRSVNSLFLNFALNSRYRDVTLFQLYDNKLYSSYLLCKLMQRTLNLRRPEVSRRIRSLRLDAMHAYSWSMHSDYYRRSLREKLSTALRASRYRHFGPNLPSIAQDLLASLTNLHTLSISLSPEPEQAFLSLVAVIWQHQFQKLGPEAMTLRTLRVNYFAGNGLQDVVRAPQSIQELRRYREALGKLDRLDFRMVKLRSSGGSQDSEQQFSEEIQSITGFLGLFTATYPINPSSTSHSRCTSNLTTLSLRLCCGNPQRIPVKVIEDIFGSLSTRNTQPPFPSLSHLSIVVTNTRECPPTILEFIALQRHTITQLRTSCNIFHALPHPIDMTLPELELPPDGNWVRAPVMTRLIRLDIVRTRVTRARFGHASTLWSYLVQASPALDDDWPEGIRTVHIDPELVISYEDLYWFFHIQPPFWLSRLTFTQDIAWMPIFKEALNRVQTLSLKLFVLSPAHLKILLTNMPNLRSLYIGVLARGEQFPFRPSLHIEAGYNECFNRSPTFVSVPPHQEEKDGLYPSFLEELNQLEHRKKEDGYTVNEELEELRVFLELVEEEVLREVTNALEGAYPGIKRVVLSNRIWGDHGFFNYTW